MWRRRMHDGTVYCGWEPSRTDLTGRSYLYALLPIGVGTAAVESLTGYISRLAAAHAVETGVLVNHELLPRIPYTKGVRAGQTPTKLPRYSFYIDAHTLNGVGYRARLWVSLLEQLTCIQRLDLLTALPWANAISSVHLLRPCRAWCPCCYGDCPSPAAYEPLLWAFQIVTVCPTHWRPLDSICPACGRTQYVFSSKSRPGYCSRCRWWLGREPEPGNFDDLTEQVRIAEMVGELLAASPSLSAGFGLDLFRENIGNYVCCAGGNLRFRASIHVGRWLNGSNAPRMDSLAALSCSQKVSMVRLLTERIPVTNIDHQRSPYAHYRIADSVVEEALRTALRAGIPPPLRDVANQLGYRSVATLQNRYPGLCSEIASQRRTRRKVSSPPAGRAPVPRERIEKALIAELSKVSLTSLGAVAVSVGLRNRRRLYKGFHDLRQAIVAKNERIRKQRVDAIENALRVAFDERPVPTVTEVARRLGFVCVTSVTSRFPKLAAELRRRRPAGLTKNAHRESEHVRQRLTEALLESPPPSFFRNRQKSCGPPDQDLRSFADL